MINCGNDENNQSNIIGNLLNALFEVLKFYYEEGQKVVNYDRNENK